MRGNRRIRCPFAIAHSFIGLSDKEKEKEKGFTICHCSFPQYFCLFYCIVSWKERCWVADVGSLMACDETINYKSAAADALSHDTSPILVLVFPFSFIARFEEGQTCLSSNFKYTLFHFFIVQFITDFVGHLINLKYEMVREEYIVTSIQVSSSSSYLISPSSSFRHFVSAMANHRND